MNNRVQVFRWICIAEGVSFITLLLVAMPLKYIWHIPEAVKVVGWAHGVLFMLYIPAVFLVWKTLGWSFFQVLVALAASVIPFGTFVLDRYWISKISVSDN